MRVAINGYGRIGRSFLRAVHESGVAAQLEIVAINEPAELESMVYLTRFDSTHGRFATSVDALDDRLLVDGKPIAVTHATAPEGVDWSAYAIDVLVECSGLYGERAELERFLHAGCPRLLLSHPGASAADVDATVIRGVSEGQLSPYSRIVSNASCTTHAAVPALALLDEAFGIEHVLLTTLHSVMNDQPLIDGYHSFDLRRTRSAMQSIIPVATGLARGIERLLPALVGRVEAKAIRVPTPNVSAIDAVITTRRAMSVEAIHTAVHEAAAGQFAGQLAFTPGPRASIDFNHDAHAAVLDGSQTRLCGPQMVNLLLWFDNEWGFAHRLIDALRLWAPHWR